MRPQIYKLSISILLLLPTIKGGKFLLNYNHYYLQLTTIRYNTTYEKTTTIYTAGKHLPVSKYQNCCKNPA